ncbi:MAG: hypothetical protein AAGH90_13320 [Pseudomonadota bacterium]
MPLQPTDLIKVERAGSHYKAPSQDIAGVVISAPAFPAAAQAANDNIADLTLIFENALL